LKPNRKYYLGFVRSGPRYGWLQETAETLTEQKKDLLYRLLLYGTIEGENGKKSKHMFLLTRLIRLAAPLRKSSV
jgi:hypothetical protein